ncbi:MAG: 4-hydroxy-tetrahydrodipicolinate reductase [Puniceicoccales bacterium]|jgi:4-hydroxy-tetrahydrodipicolinate reductase|nr:4-hydroxy-tetrahydrodipicolinate reductase [Puniceicoccales bacterium]
MSDLENILLVGASGRMGTCIQRLAQEQKISVQKCATYPCIQFSEEMLKNASVIIDFSCDSVTQQIAAGLLQEASPPLPLIVGTTGLSRDTMEGIQHYAQHAACLVASNFSLGIAILRACVRLATEKLPKSFEAELIEIHHRHKRDIPSGTAQSLWEDIRRARALGEGRKLAHHPEVSQNLEPMEVGTHSLRMGSIVGEHQVIFAGLGENLRFLHQAEDRMIFAQGALFAARWICGQRSGLYSVEDALGL